MSNTEGLRLELGKGQWCAIDHGVTTGRLRPAARIAVVLKTAQRLCQSTVIQPLTGLTESRIVTLTFDPPANAQWNSRPKPVGMHNNYQTHEGNVTTAQQQRSFCCTRLWSSSIRQAA
jgi:hypothetical protein